MSYTIEEIQRRRTISPERKKQLEELATKSLDPKKIREMNETERRFFIKIRNKMIVLNDDDSNYDIAYDME